MGDIGNIVGPVLLAIGVFSALGAIRTYRQRREVEGAGSWGMVAFVFAALFLAGGGTITANYYVREDARTVAPPDIVLESVGITEAGVDLLSIALVVTNVSSDTPLRSVGLRVTALDCPGPVETDDCSAGEPRDFWLPFDVAPGATVSVELERGFPAPVLAEGRHRLWRWALVEVNSQGVAR